MPRAMSMRATANSIASPTGGGITTLKAMIAHADDHDRHRVAEAPQGTDERQMREATASVQDRGHRDDVVGVGRVAHAEQEPESCEREELGHRVRFLGAHR